MSPKATKSKLIAGIIALLIVVLGCMFWLMIPTRRSEDELFKALMLDPIPNSVPVLHSEDNETGFDGRLWLHFKISPDDFKLVLASKKWKVDPEFTNDMDSTIPQIKDWWNPQLLGNNAVKYSTVIRRDNSRDLETIEYIWVNSQRDEVYLFYWDGFTH